MTYELASWLFTVAVFGRIGWSVAGRRQHRSGFTTFAALVVAAMAGFLLGGTIIVFGAGKFLVLLRWIAVGACVGAGMRLARTNSRLSRAAHA